MSSFPSKFSLLHTEWSSGWGGQEIRILAESKAFRDRGANVYIATQPDGQLFKKATEAGFVVIPVKMHKGLNFAAIGKFLSIIKSRRIDLVHTHSSVDHRLAAIAARLSGRPIVRSRHLSTPIKRSPFSKALYTKFADRIITSGEFIRQAMITENGMPASHIVSIPAGIDVQQFSLDRTFSDIRAELRIPSSCFVVGIVGVLRSWKGHVDLIEAVAQLRNNLPNIRLLIVGEGVTRPVLEQLIADHNLGNIVLLTGHQPDPAHYINAMDVVVLPSYANEATSQVLPQAMSMRRPVISTDIGGLPEVVINEQTGLIVPPRNPTAIAAALQRIHDDPKLRNRLAEQGYKHVQKKFTFDGMINLTQAVYTELLNRQTVSKATSSI